MPSAHQGSRLPREAGPGASPGLSLGCLRCCSPRFIHEALAPGSPPASSRSFPLLHPSPGVLLCSPLSLVFPAWISCQETSLAEME